MSQINNELVTEGFAGRSGDVSPSPFIDLTDKINKFFISSWTGGRGIGKTYSFGQLAIKDFRENGKTSVVVRRRAVEIDSTAPRYFLPNFNNDPESELFTYKNNVCYYNGEPFIWFIALNSAKRGSNFPNCNKLLYDEYIPKDGIYLKDEYKLFWDLWETVGRLRSDVPLEDDLKIILMSNNDCKYNLYTQNLKIVYNKNGVYEDELTHFEMLKSSDVFINARKKSRAGQILQRSPLFAYMYENESLYARPDLIIDKLPQNIRPLFMLDLCGYKLGVYESNNIIIIIDKENKKRVIKNNRDDFYRMPHIQLLADSFRNNEVKFGNIRSMEIFTGILGEGLYDN